jgi:NAD(P)-dependent dehydrogenase (short-subunit alcohol dehydrogenase family)
LPAAGQSRENFEASVRALPLRRGPSPDDIADTLLFLLQSRCITGQMLAVDGGEHLEWPENRGPTPRHP